MDGMAKGGELYVAALLCCACAALPAAAAPSLARALGGGSGAAHTPHLDLRPPVMRELPFHGEPRTADRMLAHRDAVRDDTHAFAGLSAGDSPVRTMSRAEAFAQRFRHEGLPVARLWENHSAMVSLGLNAKGKPGLWLVQKIH